MISCDEKLKLVEPKYPALSVSKQCQLLELSRSRFYYKPKGMDKVELEQMRIVDELYLEDPTRGIRRMSKELEKRGHRYVRYADDFSIYVKSKMAAKRVGNSIYKFLQNKLQLPINREKSGVRKPLDFQVLGFGFVPTYKKGEKGKYQLVVKPSKWKEFKAKLKQLTKKTIPASLGERIARIKLLVRGWINYFKPASIHAKLKKLEEWLRNRLRYCIWHHWKKPERKRKNLIQLGIDQDQAYAWSRTRMGGWAVAQSPILRTTITVKRLKMKGYLGLIEYYKR